MNIIETETLVLCEQTEEDAAFILELVNSRGWLKYIGDRGIKTIDEARNYIINGAMKSYAQNGFGLYLVKIKDGDMPAGVCGLIKREGLEHVDIGFAFLDKYSGKGYAFEAASAVMRYAKDVLQLSIIAAITTADNEPSIKLLNRIGLTYKGMVMLPQGEEKLMLFESEVDWQLKD